MRYAIYLETNSNERIIFYEYNGKYIESQPKIWNLLTVEEFDDYLGILIITCKIQKH